VSSLQGIGGALTTPASLAIIEAAFQPGDRTHAIGTWAGFSGVSSAIAPFLGGWLLEAGSWRRFFLINVPVAAAVAWMTQRHVPESRDTSVSGTADWPGALAGVAALGAITYAIIVLPGGGVSSPRFVAAAVIAVGASATFAVTEWRKSHPMLPPAIFRPAQFRALLCTVAFLLAVRLGPHAGYWTVVLPVALLFGLGLASLMPPLTATAMNSAPDSLAGLVFGVNNAVARVAGLLWIAALPPITGLTGASYTDPRHHGRRSFKLRCPTSPARSPSGHAPGRTLTPSPPGSRRGSAGTPRPPASTAGRAAVPPGVPGRRARHSRLARWRPRFAPRRMPQSRQSQG